jgi:small conductance mechanosensitive channel
MVLQEFGVEIAPYLAAAGIVGLAFGSVNTSSEILFLVFFIENQYRVDIVNFDNAGGTVQEISLRKTTLRDLDGTVHHSSRRNKKYQIFPKIFPINLDVGVGYSSNLEHVITVINKVGTKSLMTLYGKTISYWRRSS